MQLLSIILSLFLYCLFSSASVFGEQVNCGEKSGIKICASYHGSSSAVALVPGETTAMKIDIFYVRVENHSGNSFSVNPTDFSCVSMTDEALTIDEPLYEKIKWAKKLSKTVVEPGQKVEGYVFCPGTKHPIRTIVYHGQVVLEISFF